MVGVPRSTGCQLCRKRRVKCDEVRPACGNCKKYGTECPGYERGMKFVMGKHKVRSKGSASSGSPTSSLSASSSEANSPPQPPSETVSFLISPAPLRGQFINTMLDSARETIQNRDVSGFFSWMQLGQVGTTAGLDGALCSLAMQIVGKNAGDEGMLVQSRTIYGKSLQALQQSLQHRSRWKSSETLCSAILLCIFELFAGTDAPDSWLRHARGIGVLIEQRGPEAHAEGWDAAMLLSFRGILTMADLFFPRGERCFLARDEWRDVARDRRRRLVHSPNMTDGFIDASDDYFTIFSDVPEVIRYGYPIIEANRQGLPLDPALVGVVRPMAARCHTQFVLWYDKYQALFPPLMDIPSQDPDSIYETVLMHPIGWIGALRVSYWATMLLVQELMTLCDWPKSFEEVQQEYVRNILRSIEYMAQNALGPYRLGYAIRIAYELASADTQQWIRMWLDRMTTRYAAVDKATYPAQRGDEQGYS